MLDDYEGLGNSLELDEVNDRGGIQDRDYLTMEECDYLEEILPLSNPELLVDRIDELGCSNVPKAINSNAEVSSLIEPVVDTIDPKYLEAPTDDLQIAETVEAMEDIDGLSFDEWRELSLDERVVTLAKLESTVARIAHRPESPIHVKQLADNNYGYFSPEDKSLTINFACLEGNGYGQYMESLNTVIHEGRHAYQDYNLYTREVHPSRGDVENWRINEFVTGYLSYEDVGPELYRTQPLEADANAFAADVVSKFLRNS